MTRRKIFSTRRTFPLTEIGVCNGGDPKIPISNGVKLFHTFLQLEDRMETYSRMRRRKIFSLRRTFPLTGILHDTPV